MGCNCGKKREAFQAKLVSQNNQLPIPQQPILNQSITSPTPPKLTPRQERIMRRHWRIERRKRIAARIAAQQAAQQAQNQNNSDKPSI